MDWTAELITYPIGAFITFLIMVTPPGRASDPSLDFGSFERAVFPALCVAIIWPAAIFICLRKLVGQVSGAFGR